LDIADAADVERAQGAVRGPLHGIPFLVKDNIGSKDKMQTTAGSMAYVQVITNAVSFAVSSRRTVTLSPCSGKLALSYLERPTSPNGRMPGQVATPKGFLQRGRQCRPAYNLSQEPGGSSSGPAVAVAVNMVPFALGTETDGSVISPADRNSVVGFKPTVGLTSRAGVIPESHRQDSVGTFGKTVKDAVYALDGCFGPDPLDSYSLEQIGKTPTSKDPMAILC
jgi:amidase